MQRLLRDFAYYGRVAKELIFPRRCAVCATNIDNGYVCEQCRREYLLQRQLPCCPREEYLAGQAAPLPTDVLYSVLLLYKYEGVFKDALHKIKFDGEAGWLPLLREEAELALPAAKMRWLQQFDLIACVPTAPERRKQRGFDVPQELFAGLLEGRSVGMEVLLERVRHTQPLYELKPEERKQELAGCFALLPHARVRGKHVLLCDDIYTTGSTFAEAAQVLLDAGAARVSALALCAAQANWE